MSVAKEIKSHLKAAKLALDKQDFQSAVDHCQVMHPMSCMQVAASCIQFWWASFGNQFFFCSRTCSEQMRGTTLAWCLLGLLA